MKVFKLEEYLSNGVEKIVKGILKATVSNPKESLFMIQYAAASKKARALRMNYEKDGEHIPPFLIASITDQCNLHCKGCYARANEGCPGLHRKAQLTSGQWGDIFGQACSLGVGFILLAGGEPFTRRDVIEEAGKYPEILFPVFTNGTLMDDSYQELFMENRNLVPILSIEGKREKTDIRRGAGVYDKLQQTMTRLKESGILFGASVTVTKENLKEVTSDEFVKDLKAAGCKAVIYVEYVPADKTSTELAPGDEERLYLDKRLALMRSDKKAMLFVSFPGDEKSSGGCLAAGRGFFHINAGGGAEPCPFSPYSDTSLSSTSLRDALHSPLFVKLQTEGLLTQTHTGGCVLFEQEEQVQSLMLEV